MKAKIIGIGSFLPEQRVSNSELMDFLDVGKSSEWVEYTFGIHERRLDFDIKGNRKLGSGLFDTDLAEKASLAAVEDAGLRPQEIDHVIMVTCTPDYLHFMRCVIELHQRLGLSPEARICHINSGCAGLALGLDEACTFIKAGRSKYVLLVASNMASAFIDRRRYVSKKAWLSPVIFGDGAGAIVLSNFTKSKQGVLEVFYQVFGDHPLMEYPAGGAKNPTTVSNVDDHIYYMIAHDVRVQYGPAIQRSLSGLMQLHPFSLDDVSRVYIHQANRYLVEAFAKEAHIPLEQMGINVDRYGNTSAASTLILLDEDKKNGRVKQGDLLLFLWVGAGLINGGALVRL